MRPVSARFLAALRGSHKMVASARVCTTFQTGVNPSGTDIDVHGGDVRSNASAVIRSTVDLTTTGTGWIPKPGELLTPYGNELFIRRGIEFGDGTREWVSLGYFRIDSLEQAGSPDSPLRVSGQDRMAGLVSATLLAPVTFISTQTVTDVFSTLVGEVYPSGSIEYDWDAATDQLGRTHFAEEDRYAFLFDLAKARGKVMYYDYRGVLKVVSPPDPSVSVFDVNAGENGVLIALQRSINREGVFNAVVAMGEAPDTSDPVRAVARDMEPTSPTFWNGPFGKVPRFFQSPFITDFEHASDAARNELLATVGLPYAVDFSMVPNPALEPLDPITVRTAGGTETHIIEDLSIPLTPSSALAGSTRELTSHNITVEVT